MRQKKRWMALGLAAMMTTTAAPMPTMAEMEILSSGSEAAEPAAETIVETTAETAAENDTAETLGDGQVDAATTAADQQSENLLIETPDPEGAEAASTAILEPDSEQLSDELTSAENLETPEVGEGEEETEAATSGKCGENVTWELDSEGTLTIRGSGPMYRRNLGSKDKIVTFVSRGEDGKDHILPEAGWDPGKVAQAVIEDGVTNVGKSVFCDHAALRKVILPDSVLEIQSFAFDGCKALEEISLPSTLTTIGGYAFGGCKALEEISLPSTLTKMGAGAFQLTSLKEVVIPEGITELPKFAFANCYSLETVKLPSRLKAIGAYSFWQCENLTNIELPDSVVDIGDSAFMNCSKIENLKLPESLVGIGEMTFENCGFQEVICPDSLKVIRYRAFAECAKLEKVTFGTGLQKIHWDSFRNCEALKSLTFKSHAPFIARDSFRRESKEPITAIYPRNDESWTAEAMEDYDKNITWEQAPLPELAAPEVRLSNTNKGVRLSWNPVENAKGYEVYRKLSTDKSYTKIATIEKADTTSYLDAETRSGKVYIYAVKAFHDSDHKSVYIRQAIRSLNTPTITRAVRGKTGVSLRWKAVSGAKGYYIYRKAGNGKYVRIGTRNKVGAVTFKDTKAKKGQTYTYAVRAFNGKSMSAFVGKTVK